MPKRLRPTASLATDAILVGDPGRSLLLAQELLEQPKMSNHARGLWGYSGRRASGAELTVQATGMGGPSAAVVLADLAKLGVRRAVRVGTCAGLAESRAGEILLPAEALAGGGSAAPFGLPAGSRARPDPELLARLGAEIGMPRPEAIVVSWDTLPAEAGEAPAGAVGADMQTAALFARGVQLGLPVAALLVVDEDGAGGELDDERLAAAAKRAGRVAAAVLSP